MDATAASSDSSPSPRQFDWLTPRRFAVALAALVAAMFPDVLFGTGTFIFRDFGLFSYPLASFQQECFWSGELPHWNPLNNCGIPFLAQWSGLALYPPALFYLLLPLNWALGVFCLLHLYWGGLGMFFLARRLTGNNLAAAIAGIAFAFNGLTLNCLMWHMSSACVSWFPWVFLTAERAWTQGGSRNLILAALAGSMQMLTGPPELILATWLPIAAVFGADILAGTVARKAATLRFLTIVGLVSAIASPQILPFFELLGHSQRGAGYDIGGWAMPETGWANFLVPLFLCYESPGGVYLQHHQGVTSSYFPGIAIVALAALACWRVRTWRVRALMIGGMACLILALGEATPIYGAAKSLFPPLGLMRYPIKFVFPINLVLPLMAAWGVAEIFKPDASQKPWRTIVGITGATVVAIIFLARLIPNGDEPWTTVLINGSLRLVFLVGFAVAMFSLLKSKIRKTSILCAVAAAALIWIDLATHAPSQNPRIDRSLLSPGIQSIEALDPRPSPGHSRGMVSAEAHRKLGGTMASDPAQGHLLHRVGLWSNANMIDNVAIIDGHFPMFLGAEEELRIALYQASPLPTGLADFMAISQVTSPDDIFEMQPRQSHMPLITAGQTSVFAETDAIPGLLVQPSFNPREQAVFSRDLQEQLQSFGLKRANTAAKIELRILNPQVANHRIEFEVDTESPTLALIARSHYPAWKLRVDGQRVPLLRANHNFMAVPITDPGRHRITLVYQDNQFLTGLAISDLTLIGMIAVWIRSRPQTPESTAS